MLILEEHHAWLWPDLTFRIITTTLCVLPFKNASMHLYRLLGMPYHSSFASSRSWATASICLCGVLKQLAWIKHVLWWYRGRYQTVYKWSSQKIDNCRGSVNTTSFFVLYYIQGSGNTSSLSTSIVKCNFRMLELDILPHHSVKINNVNNLHSNEDEWSKIISALPYRNDGVI